MNPLSKPTGRGFKTRTGENTNAGSSSNEYSEYGEARDENFEMYDNNFGNVNASNIRQKLLESKRKECERGEQHALGLSYMEVEESTESKDPQFKNTFALFAAIENMKEKLDLSKCEVEYCLQQRTLKILSKSGRTEQNERQHALERELKRLKESEADLLKTNDRLRKDHASLVEQNKQQKNNMEDLKRRFDEEQGKSSQQHILLEQFATDKAKLLNENKTLNEKLLSKQSQYDLLSEEKRKMSTELSDCKTRLSRLMGSKLSDNNPDIADLSDKNRPTKLAEKYQEIYDNQWTAAFEKVEEEFYDEKKSISILKELLEDIKRHCDTMAQDQKTAMLEAVAMKKLTNEDLPSEVIKQLKDIRKTTAEISIEMVYEQYLNTFKQSHGANRFWLVSDACLEPFVKGCLELCWLMSVQDPPLAFSPDPKNMELFDSNKYKFYTRTGSSIDFVVWPPLMLHSKGPILSKGIAQACSSQEEHNKYPNENKRGQNKVELIVYMNAQAEPSAQVIARSSNEAAKEILFSNIREDSGYVEISKRSKQAQCENNYKSVVTQAETTENVPTSTKNKNARPLVQGCDAAASFHNKFPREGEVERFKSIGNMYGFNSPTIKEEFEERYDIIYEYCKTHRII